MYHQQKHEMEMKNSLLVVIALMFCLATLADSRTLSGTSKNEENGSMTWCIARPPIDTSSLNANIAFSCHQTGVDCRHIQPGGSCYSPDNLYSHSSYVMNLYYKSAGMNAWNCDFQGTGLIVGQNPSFGSCLYPAQ